MRAHRVLVAISSCFRSVSAEETHLKGLLHLLHPLHLAAQLNYVETPGEPQGPGERPSSFGEVQTVQGKMQISTSPWEPAVWVEPGDPLTRAIRLPRPGNHPHHVSLRRPSATSHARPYWRTDRN